MEATANENSGEKIIEISSPEKEISRKAIFATLIFFLLSLTLVSLGTGYVIGKSQTSQSQTNTKPQPIKITQLNENQSQYFNPNEKIKIVFPSDWQFTSQLTETKGGIFKNETGSVEFWLEVDHPITLGSEQKAGVDKTNQVKLVIDKQNSSGTEYVYKSGIYLTTAKVEATEQHPQITFLIKAESKSSYDTAQGIIKSLTFNSQ